MADESNGLMKHTTLQAASRRRANPKTNVLESEVPLDESSSPAKDQKNASRRATYLCPLWNLFGMGALLFAVVLRFGRGRPITSEEQIKQALSVDVNAPHEFKSGVPKYDRAFRLAMKEIKENTVNGSFIAGAGWTQLWTRDTAYAVELSAGLVNPAASKISLQKCITELPDGLTWLQDKCAHFGKWPHLSDAIVGAQGAWALYLSTGDRSFLEWAYSVTKRALKRAEEDAFDGSLFSGCSSFMESNSGYPAKYHQNGAAVAKTKALSTNVLHYNGYKFAAMMAQELGASRSEIKSFSGQAEKLKKAIRSRFWLPDRGYYSYFEDENGNLMPQMEGLGEALVLLAPDLETDKSRIDSIFAHTPRTKVGIPCLWPRFELKQSNKIPFYYHNGRVWPFVQGYWAIAAARHGKVAVFHEEFQNLVKSSRTNNTFAEFYELDGSFPQERRRQLWSSSGFVGMMYFGLFGIELKPKGIAFHPVKPSSGFADTISLISLPYRQAKFTIHVSGSGSVIESFKWNGSLLQEAFIPSSAKGAQLIEIKLKESIAT